MRETTNANNDVRYQTLGISVRQLHKMLDDYMAETSKLGIDGASIPVVLATDDWYVHVGEIKPPDTHREDSEDYEGYIAFTIYPSDRLLTHLDVWQIP
jgi:hypothetical protein